jgi:hypothetical protein
MRTVQLVSVSIQLSAPTLPGETLPARPVWELVLSTISQTNAIPQKCVYNFVLLVSTQMILLKVA